MNVITDIFRGQLATRRGKIRERILRVLLNKPDGRLTKYRLSKMAGASFPWTHEFLGKLEADGYVKDTRVLDFEGLIKYWTKVRRKPGSREYLLQRPLQLLRDINLSYALTTYQAENLVQGYLFPSRVDIYVRGEEKEAWHRLLAGEGLVGKGNVRILFDDDHVFYGAKETRGLWAVSYPQLIVDLFMEGGVCTEAAELLLGKVSSQVV